MKIAEVNIDIKPVIKSTVDYAYQLGIITKQHPCYRDWIITHYTQLISFFENDQTENVGFYAPGYEYIPLIEYKIYPGNIVQNEKQLINFLYESFLQGYGVILELNYFGHCTLINSINEEENTFSTIGYFNSKYMLSKVPIDVLAHSYFELEDIFDMPIKVLRKKNADFKIDWPKILYDFKAYFDSGKEEVDYHKRNVSFGLDVIRNYIAVIRRIKSYKDIFINYRSLCFIKEHKESILRKINYFIELGILNKEIYPKYCIVYDKLDICLNILIKCIEEKSIDNIIKIICLLYETIDIEYDLFQIIYLNIKIYCERNALIT